jgi:hypothetical protein
MSWEEGREAGVEGCGGLERPRARATLEKGLWAELKGEACPEELRGGQGAASRSQEDGGRAEKPRSREIEAVLKEAGPEAQQEEGGF